jgi:O-methyltransferase
MPALPFRVSPDLETLKTRLTGTETRGEPDVDTPTATFVLRFMQHYIQGSAVTMLPRVRLDNLQACIEDVIDRRVAGDFIEAGVWRGGATIFMRALLKHYGVDDRRVWVADSFEGLPEPDAEKFPREAAAHSGPVMSQAFNHLAVSLEDVIANFAAYGVLDDQVHFLKGWFNETLPAAPIEKLAVLRLDCDYYESTMTCLETLYDKLSPGGYLIIDDYGERDWTYCREAVDEFRSERGITEPMIEVDSRCCYWQRANG